MTSIQTTLLFGTAYALLLFWIGYYLLERLLYRLQAQPIRVVLAPVQIEGNGDLLRQAVSDVSHQVFRGTTLIAKVVQKGNAYGITSQYPTR